MDAYDLAVIGGGSAGLTAASGAASFGARVALIERGQMGGDCLHYGCVPTKTLVRSASVAAGVRMAHRFGIQADDPQIDFPAVMRRVREVQQIVAQRDSVERFRGFGVDVVIGEPEFMGPREIRVGDRRLSARQILVATGSRPAVPSIPGLAEAGFLTNVEALQLVNRPRSILIVGAGPIGVEFAQIFVRLGTKVTVVEKGPRVLPREDEEAALVLQEHLAGEGVRFVFGARILSVVLEGDERLVTAELRGRTETLRAEQILAATGRRANVDIAGLERAGVEIVDGHVRVDEYLRTSAPHIHAAGDVKGGLQFTHVAGYDGKLAVRNILFPGRRQADYRMVPWTIYTDPEIAHAGMTEAEARERHGVVRVCRRDFHEVDRAVIDGSPCGFVKVIADKSGAILGAHVVGSHAGELIQELVLAMHRNIPLGQIAEVIHAYPTWVEGVRGSADAWWIQRFEGRLGFWLKRVSRLTRRFS